MSVRSLRMPFALCVELLWSYAAAAILVQVVSRDTGPSPSVFAVAAVVFGSFALGRGLQETELDETALRTLGVIASIAALCVILRAEYGGLAAPWDFGWAREFVVHPVTAVRDHTNVFAGCAALAVFWARGAAGGQQTVDVGGVSRSAAFGLVVIAIAAASSPDARGPESFGGLALLYVPLSLCTLALYQTADAEKRASRFAAQWAPALAVLVAGAALLTVIAAAIDPGAFGFLAPAGAPLLFVLEIVARFVFGPIIGGIGWLFGLLPHGSGEFQQPNLPDSPLKKQPEKDTPLWLQIVGYALAGGVAILLSLLLLAALWFVFRRFTKRKRRTIEKREQIEAESLLAEDLSAMLGALARRFRRSPRRTASTIAIRRLYGEVLDRAAADGLERPTSATPLQFAPALDAHFASDAPSAISDAFAASRYGAHEPPEALVRSLRERWQRSP